MTQSPSKENPILSSRPWHGLVFETRSETVMLHGLGQNYVSMIRLVAIFAGVVLATSTALGDRFLRPLSAGERILSRTIGRGPELPHNSCDTIAAEVQKSEIRLLLLRILKLPEKSALRYLVGDNCYVQVSTFGLAKEDAESLIAILSDYVQSRADGHTANYALDSLKQRLMPTAPETNTFRAILFETFPDLPRGWVKEYLLPTANAPITNATATFPPKRFVVVDGEIAWIYHVPVLGTRAQAHLKVDAKEFDPKLRPKFEAAEKEAEQNLQRKGVKKGYGYFPAFHAEVDAILWHKHQIKRRSAWELNPGRIIH